MSIQTVEAAAHAAEKAQADLRAEMALASHGGVAVAAIARAAGVSRITAQRWIDQANTELAHDPQKTEV